MQVADRDALGEQQLQNRLQAGIGHVRRADFVGKLLVFRVEPVDQHLHVLVGQQRRQVVADDFAHMRQHDGDVVDRLEAFALQILGKGLEDGHGGHAECGFADLVARNSRLAAGTGHHEHFADTQQVRGDRRAVDADLVGLLADGDIVGDLDFGNDEAVLRGELLAHLADAEGEFLVCAKQARGHHLAKRKLDLRRAQDRLDGVLFQLLVLDDLLFFLFAPLPCSPLPPGAG
jgi:hypothetical protein